MDGQGLTADFPSPFLPIIVPERRLGSQEHVQKAAQAPHVARKAIGLPLEYLGCHVPRRANHRAGRVCRRRQFRRAAKVADPQLGLLGEVRHQNVFHLDVPMKYVPLMQALNSY